MEMTTTTNKTLQLVDGNLRIIFIEVQKVRVWEQSGALTVQKERRGTDKTERLVLHLIAATEPAGESWELH